jgi:hypothetical protein
MFGVLAFLLGYSAALAASSSSNTNGPEGFGGTRGGGKGQRFKNKRMGRKQKGKNEEGASSDSSDESEGTAEEDAYDRALSEIDLAFEIDQIGDDVTDKMFIDWDDVEEYGVFPGQPTGADVLRSAGLAQPGSWTERNVLASGAKNSWERRVAGTETEADYAVLRAARPGIASSASGYISPAWTKAPWPGSGGSSSDTDDDEISNAVLREMGL